MKKQNNICKFVTNQKSEQILTTNFVYETNTKNSLKINIQKNNAIYIVTSGSGALYTEYFKKELSAGMLFFTFAGVSYKIENTDNINYMYIQSSEYVI